MKKILHISKYYAPFVGGVEQVARDAVNALKGRAEQKVLCFNHEPGSKVDFVDEVEVTRCHCEYCAFSQSISFDYGKQLKRILTDFQPDVVIFHYPNPYVTHFLLKYLPKETILYVYWHLDITKQKLLGKVFHFQNCALLKRANTIIATSPNYVTGSRYLSKVAEKCSVVPNCINEHRLKVTEESQLLSEKIKSENEGKILCLAVGRHVPYKGFEYLIKAAKLLDDRFVVNIAGAGKLTETLKKLAAGHDNIRFIGKVSDVELKAFYIASDIFCFSSITKNEAFGLALAEAMYFGMPAVTFTIDGSGVNYVSLNDVTGLEVPNRDINAYASALKTLADKPDLKKQYGEAASLRVVKNFLFAQFQRNLINLVLGETVEEA